MVGIFWCVVSFYGQVECVSLQKVRIAEQESNERGTFDAARKLENIQKNRYRDIIPCAFSANFFAL